MSNATTDFDIWYEANEPEDQQDLEDLIQSVETATPVGNYVTVEKGGQLFVSCGTGSQLRLASDKGADRIPCNTFDQAQVTPENSSANASAHVPYMDGVVQAATGEH